MIFPDWIPSGIEEAPLDFKWNGAGAHIGPTETVTPLLDRLASKTTCAEVTLAAGVLLWGCARLRKHAEGQHNVELAEAAFAYQVDWRYCDRDAGPKGKIPDQPPAISAMAELNWFVRRALNKSRFWDSYYQPVQDVFHAVKVVEHIVPKSHKNAFASWLDQAIDRLDKIAPKPKEDFKRMDEFSSEEAHQEFVKRHRGAPIPPQVLDAKKEFDESKQKNLVAEFLRNLDWKKNRYLRSPEAMKELGFPGTPYQLD